MAICSFGARATLPPKTAAIYARLATDPTGDCLPQQIAALHTFAATHGYTITHTYQDIGSGMTEGRPDLQHLVADARARLFDVVIMRDPARLFRNFARFQDYCGLLREELGIDVIFTLQDGRNGWDAK